MKCQIKSWNTSKKNPIEFKEIVNVCHIIALLALLARTPTTCINFGANEINLKKRNLQTSSIALLNPLALAITLSLNVA
jgi:hypothetical protein